MTDYLKPITKSDWEKACERDAYYKGRWTYFQEVCWLIERIQPKSVIEIGARTLKVVPGSDTMDIHDRFRPTYCFDAAKIPWPLEKRYDLLIGLQVWEHLRDQQIGAFGEARHFAKNVILSVPYKWNRPGDKHHMIDDKTIGRWSHGIEPHVRMVVGEGSTPRLIGWWKF